MIGVLKQVDPDYGQRVADKIAADKVRLDVHPTDDTPARACGLPHSMDI